jgi:hypothetical protein
VGRAIAAVSRDEFVAMAKAARAGSRRRAAEG